MSNQLPIVIGSHAAESGKNALPHIAAYIVIGLLAFLLGVCDRSVLPTASDEPGGHAGHGKRGAAWS